MPEETDDYHSILRVQRFMEELEQGIRIANREVIHKRLPKITKDSVLSFAVVVGRLRSRYLESAFKLSVADDDSPPDQTEIDDLRAKRMMYEEAREAFEALRYAIERSYVDVEFDEG